MVILKEIALKNFKSFKDETKIASVLPFTVILGRNGAGKSNLMDAISFAMGVKTTSLRVSRTEELVHRSQFGGNQNDMSVTVILQSLDGSVTSFARSFEESSSRYRVNDKVVSYHDYVDALKRLNINPRVQNFLVFQSSIEAVVMKSPMERTKIFENISGSISLATEYNTLQSQLLQYKMNLQFLKQTERCISRELKGLIYCRKKAHEYKELGNEYEAAHINLTLFNLYYIEHNIDRLSDMVKDKTVTVLALAIEKHAAEEQLKDAMASCKKDKYDRSIIESKTREMEMKLLENAKNDLKAKTKTQYAHSRVLLCRAALESAKDAVKAREASIKELEVALTVAERNKDEYLQEFSHLLGRAFELDETQMKEYEDLKALSSRKFFVNYQRLIILEREHKAIEDELESAIRRKDERQSLVDREEALRLEYDKRIENLKECAMKIDHELSQNCQCKEKLLGSIESFSAKKRILSKELEDIRQQISDIEFQEQEKKKNKIVQDLSQLYPNVLDRLKNICNLRHNRYNESVSKVLGPHLDSIVVKTSETARLCIAHLRKQSIDTETFLPFDDINIIPLKQQLRNISRPNLKLVYDVMIFDPEIGRVIQFVTDNTLICESSEHASAIAFTSHKKDQHDCVSVDGYLYQQSGLICGGTSEITSKVQRSHSLPKATLLQRKEKIIHTLREIQTLFPTDSQLLAVELTVTKLKESLKYVEADCKNACRDRTQNEYKIQNLEDDLDTSVHTLEEISSRRYQSLKEIDQLKLQIIDQENGVFLDFCNSIGINNIRQYEEEQVSYKDALKKFDFQIYSIKEQLEFEKDRKTENDVSRWENKLCKAEDKVETYREQERRKRSLIAEEKKHIHDLELEYKIINHRIEKKSDEIINLRKMVGAIAKKYLMHVKQVDEFHNLITKERNHRHSVLTEAKVHGLRIPLIDDHPNETLETSDTEDRILSENESMNMDVSDNSNKYDFSKLPQDLTKLESDDEIQMAREELEKSVADANNAIEALADPNMKASQQVQELKEDLLETKARFEQKRKEIRTANTAFELIKKKRRDKFMVFFDFVVEQVDLEYKKLTRSSSAQAVLVPENPEEPYLGGIHYHCVVPGKRFQSTSSLSGGEKTLAALPLVFTAHSGESPPFKVLDEIDAALDNKNAMKVVNYIKINRNVQQSIVISHKKEFISGADSLIGIVSTEDHKKNPALVPEGTLMNNLRRRNPGFIHWSELSATTTENVSILPHTDLVHEETLKN